MRRQEFSVQDEVEVNQFLSDMSFGFLGTVTEDGRPRVTPLNFVYDQGCFYFHGSRVGEKMNHLRSNDQVSFTVADEYALIPSYFSDPAMACPATAYFKSVTASGNAVILEDLVEKGRIFTLFMKKLQPEGGYDPIDPADPRYASRLRSVVMVKIIANHLSAKFKFGQNLSEPAMNKVINGLETRDRTRDQETIDHMKKYCPHQQ
ncbi:pyridoxamine 5'-phosphate oxidase family protein [Paenibacillus crassostreae]|uniref:Flavin-nucleotide-binding protein n=1 Tax=Paenibacillus crassostreae TaxID=1763538 RepID=A0A167GGB4_9BACL|nr:pyridoxamine 5'-phosphate oxidase family protein [Paenibacillus crassostreae]AOZ91972.1 flavin-nucleotide-binding protein [Paenibacillus crassostreae]OAB77545.1 flavin-nucleotide-binding protein [Paenibacillus crassostreae]